MRYIYNQHGTFLHHLGRMEIISSHLLTEIPGTDHGKIIYEVSPRQGGVNLSVEVEVFHSRSHIHAIGKFKYPPTG